MYVIHKFLKAFIYKIVRVAIFYRNICNLGILSNEHLDFVKIRTKEAALSSYRNYSNNVPRHLSKVEFLALQNLRKNKNIVYPEI